MEKKHKWWHFLFTNLVYIQLKGGVFGEKERDHYVSYCSKCDTKFVKVYDDCNVLVEEYTVDRT